MHQTSATCREVVRGERTRRTAGWVALLAACLALGFATTGAARAAEVSGGPLGLGRAHAITWDKYSLKIDGRRLFVWSGEFHYWRLPSPSLWRDVLQKIKAAGFDTVQLYFDWGYHSPKQGVYDFNGIRNIDRLLNMAADAGLYVLARPGPYINAETDAGGFPDWLLTDAPLRTDSPCTRACPSYGSYLSQALDWLHRIDRILARHQLTNGTGPIIGYQVENELQEPNTNQHMADLAGQIRSDGITVPVYVNDPGLNGNWVPSSAGGTGGNRVPWNDLYGYDDYPQGFSCTNPTQWSPAPDRESTFRGYDTSTPIFSPEFGGGSVDTWGGSGYDNCRQLTGPAYERVFEQTNFANGMTMESNYMTYGGTSWGWLPTSFVYTSYDYGAMLTEGRQLTSKYYAQKQIGYFLDSVASLPQTDVGSPVAATNVSPPDQTSCANGTTPSAPTLTNCGAITVYHRVNRVTNTNFYFARHSESRSTTDSTFAFPITTPDGSYTIPQNATMELAGRDMKTIVADYNLDSSGRPQHLVYSTSNLMTDSTIAGQDVVLLWAPRGQSGETDLRYAHKPTVRTLSGTAPRATWNQTNGDLVLDYTHNGLAVVRISGGGAAKPLLLLLGDDPTSQQFWTQNTACGPVLEQGPELVRTATIHGDELEFTGDTTAPTALTVWAPHGVRTVTWNHQRISMRANADGSMTSRAQLGGPATVTLPTLTPWRYQHENPETQPGFDDSSWTLADHTTTNNPTPPPAGQPVLYSDDYGFHHGAVWYRGRFAPTAPLTSITVNAVPGSPAGLAMAWLNGTYLGSSAGSSTYTIPPGTSKPGADNVLSVLVINNGHDQYVHFRGQLILFPNNPRGLASVTTTPASTVTWKIQGNQGGENLADPVRGPMNNGGLFGERAGLYLPGFPDADWTPVTLPSTDATPGVAWYRSAFTLHEPRGVDASIGLNIADAATRQYQALIFVNGWNVGHYINNLGPQHTFVLPNGILHTGIRDDGRNTLAIAVITPNAGGGIAGGGLGQVTLTDAGPDLGVVAGGVPVRDVDSPAYVPPTSTRTAISPQADTKYRGWRTYTRARPHAR